MEKKDEKIFNFADFKKMKERVEEKKRKELLNLLIKATTLNIES
jgi:hypothetical protein